MASEAVEGNIAKIREQLPETVAEIERRASNDYRLLVQMRDALELAWAEGRNVLPDATDEQAAAIERWASEALGNE